MRRFTKKNLERLLVQLLSSLVVTLLIFLILPTSEVCSVLIVPAIAALTIWLSGILVKGRHYCLITDFGFTSIFTTLTCSYAVTLVLMLTGVGCSTPYIFLNFIGAFLGFYLPILVRVVRY